MKILKLKYKLTSSSLHKKKQNQNYNGPLTYNIVATIQYYILFIIPIYKKKITLTEWHFFASDDGGWPVTLEIIGKVDTKKLVASLYNGNSKIDRDGLLIRTDFKVKTTDNSVQFKV